MKTRQKKLLLLFLSVLCLVGASDALIFLVGRNATASRQRIAAQSSMLLGLEELLSTLKDAETGQRGYLLTGQERYLQPYLEAVNRFNSDYNEVRRLSLAGELPRENVDILGRLSQDKLAELSETIRVRREQGLAAALEIVNSDRGKKLMDGIRAEVAGLQAAKQQQIDASIRQAEQAVLWRNIIFVLTGLVNLGFLAWAFRRISIEMDTRDQAQIEAIRQKETLATTLRCIGDGVIATDASGKVSFLNTEAERLIGWKNSEAQGLPLPAIFPIFNEITRLPVESPVEKVLKLGNVVGLANHTVLRAKDGGERPIDDSAAPIRNHEGVLLGVVLVFRDVTERRRMENIKGRLAAIVECSDDAIISKDLNGIITTWNAAAERLFRYRPEEIIGKSIRLLIPPSLQTEEDEILRRLRAGERISGFETVRLARDNRQIYVSLTISPLRDADGQIVGASKIIRDVTAQRAAADALRSAKEDLARVNAGLEKTVAERTAELREMVAELEHFSYAIVHDMRAPLRAMQGFARILSDVSGPPDAATRAEYVQRIIVASERLDKLIQDALNYNQAVLRQVPITPVDLARLLQTLPQTYPNLLSDQVEIRIEGTLPVVQGSEALLTQCFSNLLGNAVKFVAPGSRPRVRIWAESANDTTKIWVEDNGIGIPSEVQSRLFGMFQKFNTGYEGNGIGLAIVRKVVERMGGKVGVESELGQGSRFWVELRLAG